jgi:predicted transcriptional regulator
VVGYSRRRQQEGASLYRIAAEVEVPQPTVARWLDQESSVTAVVPVHIKADEVTGGSPRSAGPVVVTAGGWRVEGLSVAEIADLLRVAS